MLIIILGDDKNKREKIKLDNSFESLDGVIVEGENMGAISQYLSPDLFGNYYKVKIRNWNNEDARKVLYSLTGEMQKSKSIFIIDEGDMLDATFKKLSQIADKVYDCRVENVKDSAFKLLDLVNAKKKREAWLEYMRLLKSGEPIESIIGVLNYGFNKRRDVEKSFILLKAFADDHDSKGNAEHEVEKLILKL
jgi:hypothetical protein